MTYMGRLSILMLNMFIAMLGIGLIIPIMPTYITEFGATGSTMGLLVAAAGLTQLLFAPIAGEITDKYGRRKLIILELPRLRFLKSFLPLPAVCGSCLRHAVRRNWRCFLNAVHVRLYCGYYNRKRTRQRHGAV